MSSAPIRFPLVLVILPALVLGRPWPVASQDTAPDGTPLVCRAFSLLLNDDPTGTSKMCGDYQIMVNRNAFNPKLDALTITKPNGKQSRYALASMRKDIAYLLHDKGQSPSEGTVVVTYGSDEALRFYVGAKPFDNAVRSRKVQPLSAQ